ncbi:DNA cytosine methyltransferase (plasmid) [Lactococcus lactis subsp. lactis]|uniref:DNA (cytosine-5-)-methyltransferase n=1 Tax=Lactococcus lactis TaxID=1358 RepID=Q6QPZ1_9LACT|nr:DNA cytosine methyltransferase [Lactococcus lactis]AAS99178.1 M2.LlaJI [Lactococcus lactis]QTP13237.1 DNA cytosine methyltransferase [Lactococcus lactis subsp. lactis]
MSKLRGLSLFANVGIAEAFLDEIGVDIKIANEIDKERARFYQDVYPNTNMICGDITEDTTRDLIVDLAIKEDVDFVIATPPCQGMSEAGLRLEFDKRNQLVEFAIDVIERVKPKFVLLENVPKQLTTKIYYNGEIVLIPQYIKKELGNMYNFNEETLIMAKDHGVPQLRERNIFLLVRKDINLSWEFPKKQKEITLRDAIGNLPSLDPLLRDGYEKTIEKFPDYEVKKSEGLKVSKWHYPPTHSWKQVEWMLHTPSGKSAIYNEIYYPQKEGGIPVKAHHNHYRRLKWDMPCRTITQNNGVISSLACVHPGREYVDGNGELLYSDGRVLTIYELMIVMSLPLDWPIPSWAKDNFIRKVFGEGIPSKLVKAIMLELINRI